MKKNNFLETGDVILLKKGMAVYAPIPKKFVYANTPMSNESTRHDVKIGKVYVTKQNTGGDIRSLAKDIVEDFDFRLGVKLTIV